MTPLDVRRLAAIDTHGLAGSRIRRRLIVAEFVLATVGCVVLGLLSATRAQGAGWRVIGVWRVGIGVNYFVLALPLLLVVLGVLQLRRRPVPSGARLTVRPYSRSTTSPVGPEPDRRCLFRGHADRPIALGANARICEDLGDPRR